MWDAIFQALLGAVAAPAGAAVYSLLVGAIRSWAQDQTEANVLQALRDLGSLTEADVLKRVEEFAGEAKLTRDQQQDLTTLLLKLAHGARFHTTHGTPYSAYLRSKDLLRQLLDRLLPLKRVGSPVAVGLPDWKLKRFLGMGTFGEVWLAENEHYHPRERAYKFFTRKDGERWLAGEQQNLLHIRRELRGHPNIVEFLDVSFGSKPHPYIALEYVGGGSLEEWLLQKGGRLPLKKLEIVRGVVRGLAQAHSRGISHRDLKPANILLTDDPTDVQAKITDFGLGKVKEAGVTEQGPEAVTVGTTLYQPPEALDLFRPRDPAQDDVFAVGIIWYQSLTERLERPPYDFAAQLRQAAVDSHTIRLVERCLARPENRFRDAGHLEESLDVLVPDAWEVPPDCFDVGYLAREYLAARSR
jgi:serine/threonine protein kinase